MAVTGSKPCLSSWTLLSYKLKDSHHWERGSKQFHIRMQKKTYCFWGRSRSKNFYPLREEQETSDQNYMYYEAYIWYHWEKTGNAHPRPTIYRRKSLTATRRKRINAQKVLLQSLVTQGQSRLRLDQGNSKPPSVHLTQFKHQTCSNSPALEKGEKCVERSYLGCRCAKLTKVEKVAETPKKRLALYSLLYMHGNSSPVLEEFEAYVSVLARILRETELIGYIYMCVCINIYIQMCRKRVTMRNCLMLLWRLRSPMICHLQAGGQSWWWSFSSNPKP